MRTMNIWLKIAMIIIILGGCDERPNQFREEFRWLSGKWRGELNGMTMIERWKWEKGRYVGVGFQLNGEDTLNSEALFIEQFANRVGYAAVIDGEGPFMFRWDDAVEESYDFVNELNDFPKIVRYAPSRDSVIQVTLLGDDQQMRYELKRVQR